MAMLTQLIECHHTAHGDAGLVVAVHPDDFDRCNALFSRLRMPMSFLLVARETVWRGTLHGHTHEAWERLEQRRRERSHG
jgi:hypothetical protein